MKILLMILTTFSLLASETDQKLFDSVDVLKAKVESRVCDSDADQGGKKAVEDYEAFKKCVKKVEENPQNRKNFKKFVETTESILLESLQKEKDPDKIAKIKESLKAIKVGRKAAKAWRGLPPVFQDLVGRIFHKRMSAKLKDLKSKIRDRVRSSGEEVELMGLKIPKEELANAVQLLADNIDSIEKKMKTNEGLYSKVNLDSLEEFKNNPEKAEKFKIFISENMTEEDQRKIEELYKKAETNFDKDEIRLKLIDLYNRNREDLTEVANVN